MSKYWVKYRWKSRDCQNCDWQEPISIFVTTGEDREFPDLESWWFEESRADLPHELLEVVKL